eukprot:1076114-Prymnesium_polylepis.1
MSRLHMEAGRKQDPLIPLVGGPQAKPKAVKRTARRPRRETSRLRSRPVGSGLNVHLTELYPQHAHLNEPGKHLTRESRDPAAAQATAYAPVPKHHHRTTLNTYDHGDL